MNIYWVYDLPIWLFGVLTIAVTVAIALGGFYATRKWVRRIHRDQHSHNDIVGFYLGAICLFYGITLGLLAVGTWQAYSVLDAKVGEEASALASGGFTTGNFYRGGFNASSTGISTTMAVTKAQFIAIKWR